MQQGDQNPNFFLYAFFIVIMLCLKIFVPFPLLKLFHCFFLNWVMLRTSAQAPTFCSQKFKTGETYVFITPNLFWLRLIMGLGDD